MVDQQAIALMQEARAKEAKNDLSGAIKKYRRVVEKHPLSREAPQARFRMAELYEARKEPAEAFDQYQKLIDRHPDSPPVQAGHVPAEGNGLRRCERRADQPRAVDV